ncbi:hypothetical protein PYCC9005_001904 [Savitreella phatthalungensis]
MTETLRTINYIVVGAGVFGLTTAIELAQRGHSVVLVDRERPPVRNSASCDSSRIIRSDYADSLYANLANEAQSLWRSEYPEEYHESGLLIMADDRDQDYVTKAASNVGAQVEEILPGINGYMNPNSGWVDAEAVMQKLWRSAQALPLLRFVIGEVTSLRREAGHVVGVCLAGSQLDGHVILCTGAWQLVDLPILATGQVLGYIALSSEQEVALARRPAQIHFSSGWYQLPPHKGELKIAIHDSGYTRHIDGKSVPWMGEAPAESQSALLEGLSRFLGISDAKLFRTRLCWYSDTADSNFLVDHLEPGLFVATGGSGHAFKFLPVLGREIVRVLDGKTRLEWTIEHARAGFEEFIKPFGSRDNSRGRHPRKELVH